MAKLEEKIRKLPNLSTITTNDYDVYKSETTINIQDSAINNSLFLNVKIVAKGENFTGKKDNITVNYILRDQKINLNRNDLKKL
ncbi:hypothetical protein [Spiroplasma ixodetis]|uniref:Uncharacterized protein n=1 Tax=Spiroplasma ixodetis TaxID=2141 RepID=A0ABM8JLG0_9MOLU